MASIASFGYLFFSPLNFSLFFVFVYINRHSIWSMQNAIGQISRCTFNRNISAVDGGFKVHRMCILLFFDFIMSAWCLTSTATGAPNQLWLMLLHEKLRIQNTNLPQKKIMQHTKKWKKKNKWMKKKLQWAICTKYAIKQKPKRMQTAWRAKCAMCTECSIADCLGCCMQATTTTLLRFSVAAILVAIANRVFVNASRVKTATGLTVFPVHTAYAPHALAVLI